MIQQLNPLDQRFSVPGLNSLLHVSECCLRSKVQISQLSDLVLFFVCFPFLIQQWSMRPLSYFLGLA